MENFKVAYSFELRKRESNRIIEKFVDKIPVIVERHYKSTIADIDKKKFLVPNDILFGEFLNILRKRIKLSSTEALFVFVNNTTPALTDSMGIVYNNHKDEDGFLYLCYTGQNFFG
jgi:GABA(A) receptor-associated protein